PVPGSDHEDAGRLKRGPRHDTVARPHTALRYAHRRRNERHTRGLPFALHSSASIGRRQESGVSEPRPRPNGGDVAAHPTENVSGTRTRWTGKRWTARPHRTRTASVFRRLTAASVRRVSGVVIRR